MVHSRNSNAYALRVFDEVISCYHELGAGPDSSVADFYRGLSRAANKGSVNPKVPVPNKQDFLADVWLAAKRTLSEAEFDEFKRRFLDGEYREPVKGELTSLRLTVGRAMLSRGLYPFAHYFRVPAMNDICKCTCGNTAHVGLRSATIWCAGGCGLNMTYHVVGMPDVDPVKKHNIFWCVSCEEEQGRSLLAA